MYVKTAKPEPQIEDEENNRFRLFYGKTMICL